MASEGFDVVALEPDGSDLVGAGAIRALAKDAGLKIDVAEGHSESIPCADAGFDLVFARACLHHTRDLKLACREMFRVLKPGGRFLAVREHVITRRADLPAFLRAHALHELYGGENAFLLDEYREAFRAAGFRLTRTLAPLESVVNYAPHTPATLRDEIAGRFGRVPGGAAMAKAALRSDAALRAFLGVLGLIDNRPGRLYSFICEKP